VARGSSPFSFSSLVFPPPRPSAAACLPPFPFQATERTSILTAKVLLWGSIVLPFLTPFGVFFFPFQVCHATVFCGVVGRFFPSPRQSRVRPIFSPPHPGIVRSPFSPDTARLMKRSPFSPSALSAGLLAYLVGAPFFFFPCMKM